MTTAAFLAEERMLEGIRQGDANRATANFTGAAARAALESANRDYSARVVASGVANGVPAPLYEPHRQFCLARSRPAENVTAPDTTPFSLWGGRYLVTCTATWDTDAVVT